MDPLYDFSEGEAEAEAMAKAMGFASFGTQGPSKKRKFNLKTDAMVEGQELISLDRGGKKGEGSGGNNVPLGKPRVFGITTKGNKEEIDLDIEDKDEDEPAHVDTNLPPPPKGDISDEDESPSYIDTSLPPPNEDTILANSVNPPVPPDSTTSVKYQVSDGGKKPGRFMNALQDDSMPASSSNLTLAMTSRSRMDYPPSRQRREKNELWYVGYYDPSFNENPWAKLEKANGLVSRGTWIESGGKVARNNESFEKAMGL